MANGVTIEREPTDSEGHVNVRLKRRGRVIRPSVIERPDLECYFGEDGWAMMLAVPIADTITV
jgi:hypothetical protein